MRSEENRRITIYRGSWYVVWRETNPETGKSETKRSSLRTKDRAEAERHFQIYLGQDESPQTINDILGAWASDKSHLNSIDIAKAKMKPVKEFFGNLKPEHITKKLCRDYAKKRGKKNTTIRNELSVLRCAVNWNDKHNKAIFEFPPVDPPKDHYLKRKEYLALLKATKAPHLKLFMLLALHTAGRATALLELTWDRVDFDKKQINLAKGNHKNKRRALIPMNDTLLPAMKEAYKARTCEYVIERGGKNVESVRKGFGMAAEKAGVEASPHVLRHTAAVVMAESRIPMSEISQFLGHTGGNTTERVYARYSPDYLRKAAQSLHRWHTGGKGSK